MPFRSALGWLIGSDTDCDWEKYGSQDPYFGVITDDKFRGNRLSDERKAEFFELGQQYVDEIMENIRRHLDPAFRPSNVVDFGCGVGRATIALARIADRVVGLDVSPSMLQEAEKNCASFEVKNVELLPSDDDLSNLSGMYDLLHTSIVFQHIPVGRGMRIFKRLLTHLEPGGIGVLHFTYAKSDEIKRLIPWLKSHIPFVRGLSNVLKGRAYSAPQMQMNSYDLNRVFQMIQQSGVRNIYSQFTDHGGELGTILYFQKLKADPE